jgi:ABC transporter substrate binding protein
MRRRDVIGFFGGAAMWSLAAHAQRGTKPTIGFLCSGSAAAFTAQVAAFRDGLNEIGYVDGRNVAIEFAWAEGRYDTLPSLAANLVSREVAVIAAVGGAVAGLGAKAATSTIPIVLAIGDDPVKFGLVSSLNHPGGNITGVTLFIDILAPKRIELLLEVAPEAALAMMVNPRNPNAETEAGNAGHAQSQPAGRHRERSHRARRIGNDADRPHGGEMMGHDRQSEQPGGEEGPSSTLPFHITSNALTNRCGMRIFCGLTIADPRKVCHVLSHVTWGTNGGAQHAANPHSQHGASQDD